MAKINWTREEILVALNVYCKIPFKSSRATNPIVMEFAKLLNRTPAALNLKIGNLGHFDENLKTQGIIGLTHVSKLDEQVWNEFQNDSDKIIFESEQIIARLRNQTLEQSSGIEALDLPQGMDRTVFTKTRINQRFFRIAVLTAYENKCCISGVSNVELLEACHISSWKDDIKNRTNPKNGLCMNPFFHRAFDNYLFTVTPEYKIEISGKMFDGIKTVEFRQYLERINGTNIILPEKFLPDVELLEKHYETYKRTA